MAENEVKKEAEIGICPICKQGKIVDKGKFYGCTNYKSDQSCKFTLPKKWSNKTITKSMAKSLVVKGSTNKLKGFQSKKTGKEFSAKLTLLLNFNSYFLGRLTSAIFIYPKSGCSQAYSISIFSWSGK